MTQFIIVCLQNHHEIPACNGVQVDEVTDPWLRSIAERLFPDVRGMLCKVSTTCSGEADDIVNELAGLYWDHREERFLPWLQELCRRNVPIAMWASRDWQDLDQFDDAKEFLDAVIAQAALGPSEVYCRFEPR